MKTPTTSDKNPKTPNFKWCYCNGKNPATDETVQESSEIVRLDKLEVSIRIERKICSVCQNSYRFAEKQIIFPSSDSVDKG